MKKRFKFTTKAGIVAFCLVLAVAMCLNGFIFSNSVVFAGDDQPEQVVSMDFTINGQSFTDATFGGLSGTLEVPDNFNMDKLEEFYVTKIVTDKGTIYNYEPNEYTLALKDSQDRTIFETHFDRKSDHMVRFRAEAHSGDILAKDIPQGKTKADYYPFYITGIDFVTDDYRGVNISTPSMPDHYDFTTWTGVDLASTTASNPGKATVYYGEGEINFTSLGDEEITDISLVNNGTVPDEAIAVKNSENIVLVHSNFYNEVPLKITLSDGTVGYVNVTRIGLFITDLNGNQTTLYHGSIHILLDNFLIGAGKNRIAATFYHHESYNYDNFDLVVNITYTDGSTETKLATGVGTIPNEIGPGPIAGSDYLLWQEDGGKRPQKLSVTAVRKGALDSEDEFGGAQFGSGAGIEWEYRR